MLQCQVQNISAASKHQTDFYELEGWKSDDKGIDRNIEILQDFTDNFRRVRDAKPSKEEMFTAEARVLQTLQQEGIPLTKTQRDKLLNYDRHLKSIISKKEKGF